LLSTLLGLYIRYRMPESLAYVLYYAGRKKPTTQIIYQQSAQFIKKHPFLFKFAFFTSFFSVATGFFFYLYIPMYATEYSSFSRSFILHSTTVSLVFTIILIPLFGWISDKTDRVQMLRFA